MSRFRGKRKEDYASEGDSEGQAPSKKASKKDSSDESTDDIVVCEISKTRRVTVRNWQGRAVVDIREFYVKDGKQLPGKKGISLTMDQWNVLRDHVEEIEKAVNENS
ncbi:RNA polymerase II transcriptional coactivator KIWI [Juglans microcarpa x Juglans regia]|uniref:RNA polymerase II transcriptional coactivator KIWI n=1 Tax=Juglans microcarpa x Juglans regia TaxID=2249226 RepID=UPI001B7E7F0D|nr:RNA polymerase II transcriptional coactivator KIWI [Juglans microcarpa x Juglans regia]